ncbi:hypothetical protein D3C85_1359470 [compost metagenome]
MKVIGFPFPAAVMKLSSSFLKLSRAFFSSLELSSFSERNLSTPADSSSPTSFDISRSSSVVSSSAPADTAFMPTLSAPLNIVFVTLMADFLKLATWFFVASV